MQRAPFERQLPRRFASQPKLAEMGRYAKSVQDDEEDYLKGERAESPKIHEIKL